MCVCLVISVLKKSEGLQGFQQAAAKPPTGRTASTVPAEEKRYSISNVSVNINWSADTAMATCLGKVILVTFSEKMGKFFLLLGNTLQSITH